MVSMAMMRVSSSLVGMTIAACHLVHLSIMWKMINLRTNRRSHSTCWLNLSAISVLHALLGPGLANSRQTVQVLTVLGIRSRTFWATPTRSRNRFMVCSEACHHRTWSLRNVRRIAASRFVRKTLITRPMSKLLQSWGFSGLSP